MTKPTAQNDTQPDTITKDLPLAPRDGLSFQSINGETIGLTTRDMEEEHAQTIRWLFNWGRSHGWTAAQLADETKISWTTLYRVFTGKYSARIDNICDRINSFRRLAEERESMGIVPFVETSISKKFFKACDYALVSQSLVFVYGDSQIGKTFTGEEYQRRNNHGQTKYVRMPASAGVQLMMQEFARACYISPRSSFDSLRESVLNALSGHNLVIVDELHQVFLSYQKGSAIKCLEVIREIHDRTKCGMVLCGTLDLKKQILLGQHSGMLEQFRRRGVLEIALPSKLPKADLDRITSSYGLPPAEDDALALQTEIMRDHGLGKFTKFIQAANRMASKNGEALSWDHVIRSHDILAKLSTSDK
jgi:DNA transposition AAA+ family ATPase